MGARRKQKHLRKDGIERNPHARQKFQARDRTLPFKGPEAIDAECLECFEYEYADRPVGEDVQIRTTTEEFTSVCPFSGLPDFASVTITYTPGRYCIELRSLKYYLLSYRDVGIWYEHLVNRMLEDLVRACRPLRMTVVIECKPRGGLSSTVSASYAAPAGRRATAGLTAKPMRKA
jgi:7-cyano-7-deazaguanine reductase